MDGLNIEKGEKLGQMYHPKQWCLQSKKSLFDITISLYPVILFKLCHNYLYNAIPYVRLEFPLKPPI